MQVGCVAIDSELAFGFYTASIEVCRALQLKSICFERTSKVDSTIDGNVFLAQVKPILTLYVSCTTLVELEVSTFQVSSDVDIG